MSAYDQELLVQYRTKFFGNPIIASKKIKHVKNKDPVVQKEKPFAKSSTAASSSTALASSTGAASATFGVFDVEDLVASDFWIRFLHI